MKDYILHVQTVQCSAIRNLFETLKDVLQDCNFIFDTTSVKCLQMDNNQNVIVSVNLNSSSFEQYYCKTRFVAGLNVANMFRLIKGISQNDTLALFVLERDPNVLQMELQNLDKNMTSRYKLNLLDIDEINIDIPIPNLDVILTMPSIDFQRMCRDLSILSETLLIEYKDRRLILSANGDFASQTIELGEKENGLFFSHLEKDVEHVKSKFSLKYINLFSKANVLCSTVDIYLKRSYPIILSYTVASLGKLIFCIAQKDDD